MTIMKLLKTLKTKFANKSYITGQVSALAVAVLCLLLILAGVTQLKPSWFSWFLTLPAHAVILLTVLARVKDLKDMRLHSQARRIGLTLVGTASVAFAAAPFFLSVGNFPTWPTVLLLWGIAVSWFTTPNQPPWWKYISGELTAHDQA